MRIRKKKGEETKEKGERTREKDAIVCQGLKATTRYNSNSLVWEEKRQRSIQLQGHNMVTSLLFPAFQ